MKGPAKKKNMLVSLIKRGSLPLQGRSLAVNAVINESVQGVIQIKTSLNIFIKM